MIRVFNTMNRKKENFVPIKGNKVGMYVCGVTVYDYCHIGHARSIIAFDVINRYLRKSGYDVTFVRNFTDIDDKIINRANQEGKSWKEIAETFIEAFYEDIDKLFVLRPEYEPKATEHIPEMIELIKKLEDKGFAYSIGADVYYNVEKFKPYGKLSGRSTDEMMAGARIEIDEKKRNPLDFALWKASKENEPYWDSPWGKGRPGWHIECSAMSMKYLGETFDIHGGGLDLIFPHHENEIAQSEAATGKPFVMYWIHNGFVSVNKEKMSKSLGNVVLIRDILKKYHPEVLRLFLIKTHYRNPIDFNFKAMDEEKEALERLYRTKERVKELLSEKKADRLSGESQNFLEKLKDIKKDFYEAMDDDFNSALSMAKVFEASREFNKFLETSGVNLSEKSSIAGFMEDFLKDVTEIFGILNLEPDEWKTFSPELDIDISEIEKLIKERSEARKNKDYKKADEIRDYLYSKGIILEDRPDGTTSWRIKK